MRIGEDKRSYRLRTTPMRDEDGKLLGAVTVLEDVTQMQEVDRFKTRFISVASQKLRDPLQRIRLSLYTLAKGFGGELKPLQADLLQGAEEEAEALNDLMSDLIDVAELDTGRRELKIERLRPSMSCRRPTTAGSKRPAPNGSTSKCAPSPISRIIDADRRALRSIFDNLLSNAIRYTPAGGSILSAPRRSKTGSNSSCATADAASRPSGCRLSSVASTPLRNRRWHRTRPGAGSPTRRSSRRTGRRREPLGAGTTFNFTVPMSTVQPTRHPVEVG